MKVAHLTSLHPAHDIRIFHKQCKSLINTGYEVTLVVKSEKDKEIDGVKIRGIRSYENRLKRFFLSSWEVYNKAIRSKATICHFHDPELIFIAILLRMRGKKVIYDVHEDLPRQIMSKDWINPRLRHLVSRIAALIEYISSRFIFTAIVAATPKIAARFAKSKTVLVQNYPMINELSESLETLWSTRKEQIVYIGGLDTIRGAIENIKALELLNDKNVKLVLAGPFSSESLERKCRSLRGWRYIDYHSWLSREEVKEKLSQSKVGLVLFHPLPNHIDAQPNKMYEYMSASIPIIASDFPLWREIVDSTKCGLLVDPLNPAEIAIAIEWLLGHPKEAEQMGKNGRKMVETKYNWEHEEKKLLQLYKKLDI